ncbi:hybrid sensor histidine kinase/response regulator, partial [Thioclava sp. BHET1]
YLFPDGPRPKSAPAAELASFEDVPVALLQLDDSGMLLRCNRLARDLLGLGVARAEGDPDAGLHVADLLAGLGRPVGDWVADVLAGRNAGRPEVLRAVHSEADRFLQVSLRRTLDEGRPGVLAVLNDATELKTLEAQIVQSQKMQAIGQLAGGVAHDFNNLLTAISGHCDLLLLRHEKGDPDYGDLVQIHQNANRAASLVRQLLAFSRKQTLQPELIDLNETLGDLTHLL